MDFEHEAVKVHPAAGSGGKCVEQSIHDQGFAPTNGAPQIESPDSIARGFPHP